MQENGESELTQVRAEIARVRSELADLRQSFNQFVRSQASLVGALRQAEEAAQSRHRFQLSTINDLRAMVLSGPSESTERVVKVTDEIGRKVNDEIERKVNDEVGRRTGAIPVLPTTKPKGEVTGEFEVGGIRVQLDGKGEHFKDLAFKVGRWMLVIIGMLATGGVGWLIGFVKKLGEGTGK